MRPNITTQTESNFGRRATPVQTAGIVLAQLVHHGNEHRAHATTILGSNGRTTPKIGAWTYGIANGISKNDGD